jgi:hypothetical protein
MRAFNAASSRAMAGGISASLAASVALAAGFAFVVAGSLVAEGGGACASLRCAKPIASRKQNRVGSEDFFAKLQKKLS